MSVDVNMEGKGGHSSLPPVDGSMVRSPSNLRVSSRVIFSNAVIVPASVLPHVAAWVTSSSSIQARRNQRSAMSTLSFNSAHLTL